MRHKFRVSFTLSFCLAVGFLAAEEETSPEEAAVFKGNFIIVPTVSSSPGFGNSLGSVAVWFFDPDKTDTNSPPSSVTAVGSYSDTDSYFTGLFGQIYLNEDQWRLQPGLAHGRVNSELDIPGLGDVAYETQFSGLFMRAQRRVYQDWYGGLQVMFQDTQYEEGNPASAEYFDLYDIEDTQNIKLGLLLSYDSREHLRYPMAGQEGQLAVIFAPDGWNDDGGYYVTEGHVTSFHQVGAAQVLALKVYGKSIPDDAPYFEKPTLGQRGDIRGYTPGEIVGDKLLSSQLEWRSFFTPLIGGVVFGGAAGIWEGDLTDVEGDDVYWSYGLGLRIRLQKENRMNFRIDYAWGEDDQDGFYVGVGEAF